MMSLRYITLKPTKLVIWIILSAFFFKPLIFWNSFYLWTLIKNNKFIYVILINFIIISILISSTSLTPFFNNVFLKLYKSIFDDNHESLSPPEDDDDDDDVWWFLSLSQTDEELSRSASFGEDNLDVQSTKKVVSPSPSPSGDKEDTWWFFSLPEEEKEETYSEIPVLEEEKSVLGEEGEDSLDETWKAIMESKEKESGPQLKKSDTWSAGDGKERGGVIGGLSKYKVTVELKKWQSFRDMIQRRDYCFGGDAGGGDKRGWKSVDMALTFHDEFKKRADAFIARFTHDIRLQRLESHQRFMDMINRGQ